MLKDLVEIMSATDVYAYLLKASRLIGNTACDLSDDVSRRCVEFGGRYDVGLILLSVIPVLGLAIAALSIRAALSRRRRGVTQDR